MISKVVIFAAALTAVCAHDAHGHAVSSQFYIQHDDHHHPQHHHEQHHPPQYHHHPGPKVEQHHEAHNEEAHIPHKEHHQHQNYEYSYNVKDPHTHDMKSQSEHREGGIVKGEYSLHQPDGLVRTVKYHSDHKGGFHADVHYSHPTHHVHHQH